MTMSNRSGQDQLIDDILEVYGLAPKALHERASELTRRKILDVAMQCFATKGYQGTNIREIAKGAGVTQGAVYHHFKDKKDLLMQANRFRQIYMLEVVRDAMTEERDFFGALRTGLGKLFRRLLEDSTIRGVTREYVAMAMTDADINEMYRSNDLEVYEVMSSELQSQFPEMDSETRARLAQMLYVSLEGLFTALVVDSPIVAEPEIILNGLIDMFEEAVENQA